MAFIASPKWVLREMSCRIREGWQVDLPNHRPSDCQDKVRRPARIFYNAVVSTFQMFSGRPAIPGPHVTSLNVTSFASSFEMSSGAAGEALLTGRRPSPSFKLRIRLG